MKKNIKKSEKEIDKNKKMIDKKSVEKKITQTSILRDYRKKND